MASYARNVFSIVFLGQFNPSILNHEFLVANDIIPKNIPPFVKFLQKPTGQQFSEFLSTPVVSNIKYDKYSMLVETGRMQVLDETRSKPEESPIIDIAKKYLQVLRHTPIKLCGFNFKGNLRFVDVIDEREFDERLGVGREKIVKLSRSGIPRISQHISWSYKNGTALLQINKPKGESPDCLIQINFEFENFGSLEEFLKNLDLVAECHDEFRRLLSELEVK